VLLNVSRVRRTFMSAAVRKTYWDLRETLLWVCRREEEGVAAVRDTNEEGKLLLAMFSAKAVLDPFSRAVIAEYDFEADNAAAVWPPHGESPYTAEFGVIGPSQALNYLLKQVYSHRVRMTAIRCDRYRAKQIPVPPVELNDLEFRITPNQRITKAGLWSRSRNSLMLRSPQFLRADIIRVWPPRKKDKAAIFELILRHLQAISTSAAPLTQPDAQRRCLAEVPDAYPEAFKKAWVRLDPVCKRPRGRCSVRGASREET
jgi:hypothetical protein